MNLYVQETRSFIEVSKVEVEVFLRFKLKELKGVLMSLIAAFANRWRLRAAIVRYLIPRVLERVLWYRSSVYRLLGWPSSGCCYGGT